MAAFPFQVPSASPPVLCPVLPSLSQPNQNRGLLVIAPRSLYPFRPVPNWYNYPHPSFARRSCVVPTTVATQFSAPQYTVLQARKWRKWYGRVPLTKTWVKIWSTGSKNCAGFEAVLRVLGAGRSTVASQLHYKTQHLLALPQVHDTTQFLACSINRIHSVHLYPQHIVLDPHHHHASINSIVHDRKTVVKEGNLRDYN